METLLKITPEIKELVIVYLTAKTWYQTLHPIVKGYQQKIIEELHPINEETGEVITKPNMLFMADEETLNNYVIRCEEETAKHKLPHDPDHCPLYTAESQEITAKKMLLEHLLPLLPGYKDIKYSDLLIISKNKDNSIRYDKFGRCLFRSDELLDICLPILVSQISYKDFEYIHT